MKIKSKINVLETGTRERLMETASHLFAEKVIHPPLCGELLPGPVSALISANRPGILAVNLHSGGAPWRLR